MDSRFEISLDSIDFLLMNHMLGASTPLLRVQLQPSTIGLEHVVGSKVGASLSLSLLASSYNPRNAHWEPVLERWSVTGTVLHKTAAAIRDGHEFIGIGGRCSPLSLNVTHAFLSSLVTMVSMSQGETEQQLEENGADKVEESTGGDFIVSPYWILNATGCPLSYVQATRVDEARALGSHGRLLPSPTTTSSSAASHLAADDTASLQSASTAHHMRPGEQTPIEMASESNRREELNHRPSLRLTVHVQGEAHEIDGVVFDKVGTRMYRFSSGAGTAGAGPLANRLHGAPYQPHESHGVVCDVKARVDGTNILVVRSPLRLRNATEVPIDVLVYAAATTTVGSGRENQRDTTSVRTQAPSNAPRWEAADAGTRSFHVRAGDVWAVPLDVYHQLRYGLSIRPRYTSVDEPPQHEWSRRVPFSELIGGSYFRCPRLAAGRRLFSVADSPHDSPQSVRRAPRGHGSGRDDGGADSSPRAGGGGRRGGSKSDDEEDGASPPASPKVSVKWTGSSGGSQSSAASSFYCNVDAIADESWDEPLGAAPELGLPLERELWANGRPAMIAFHAPFTLQNLLAKDTHFSIRSKAAEQRNFVYSDRLERGSKISLHCLNPSRSVVLSFEVDGFNASSKVTLKSTYRGGRADARGLQQTLQKLQSLGRYVPEIGSFTTQAQAKVIMTDRAHRPLNVHLDTWEGIGGTFNIAAFTTYWLVNKSALPLAFRRMVPTLSGALGGRLRPETAMHDGAGASGVDDDGDSFALLGDPEAATGGSGAMHRAQPPPGSGAFVAPLPYDPTEVTAGPLMISYTRPSYQWPFNHAALRIAGDSSWSAPFQLDKPAAMSIASRVGQGSYELGIECRFAPAPFHRTRLVFICCRLVLVRVGFE